MSEWNVAAPLDGLRVAELGELIAVPYAGKILADLGAQTLKFERSEGDSSRRYGPFSSEHQDIESSGLFSYLNAGKRSITKKIHLNKGDVSTATVFEWADVVLLDKEWLPEIGESVEEMHVWYPSTIFVVVSGFGLTGPYGDFSSADLVCSAAGGISVGVGESNRRPLPLPQSQVDYQTGTCAALAAMMSVVHRRVTGNGDVIDIAKSEIMTTLFSGYFVPRYVFSGGVVGIRSGRDGQMTMYPNTVFECLDGLVRLDTPQLAQWIRLLELMGNPKWSHEKRYRARRAMQSEYKAEIDALVEPWFLERTKADLFDLFLQHRLPYAPVFTGNDLLEEPQLVARGALQKMTLSGGSAEVTVPASQYFVNGRRPAGNRAPMLGEANDLLDSLLATSRAGISAMFPPVGVQPESSDTSVPRAPLTGIKVLDLGTAWAGGIAGRMLSDFGADVIKVESWTFMDGSRKGRPILVDDIDGGDEGRWPDMQPGFHVHSRGKRSIAVNLKIPEGRDLCLKLAANADVLIHNFPPGVMERLNLSHAELHEANPNLIVVGQSVGGAMGPRSDMIGYAGTVSALSGLASEVGYQSEPPIAMFEGLYNDVVSALAAALAAVTAIIGQFSSPEGVMVDISQWEAALVLAPEILLNESLSSGSAEVGSDYHPLYFPHRNFPTAGEDSWIAIAIQTPEQWVALCGLLDRPEWGEKFSNLTDRRSAQEEIEEAIENWTASQDRWELAWRLVAVKVPAFPVLNIEDLFLDENYNLRELFVDVPHPLIGSEPMPNVPWRSLVRIAPTLGPAPLLGEHSFEIASSVGLSQESIDELVKLGAIEVSPLDADAH